MRLTSICIWVAVPESLRQSSLASIRFLIINPGGRPGRGATTDMDIFGSWAGAGHQQHEDVYLQPRPAAGGHLMSSSCGRFDMDDDAFFGQCVDGVLGTGDAGGGTTACGYGVAAGDPMGFLSSDGAGAHDGLLDAALAFSRVLACGADPGAGVSNGAMFSSGGHSGTTTVCNISSGDSNNNYSGGGHDNNNEVVSPTSTVLSPTSLLPNSKTPCPKRKLPDVGYPATTLVTPPQAPAPLLPRPAGAKRRALAATTSINFGHDTNSNACGYEPDVEAMAQVKEMIYRAAAMRPVSLVTAEAKPRRKNVRISSDPQTVAARLRRERVSDRLRVLQKLVPGGSKMDTASMLDEAASYLKFLRSQVQALETLGPNTSTTNNSSNAMATGTGRLHRQSYYSSGNDNNSGFLGFARNNNISAFGNPNNGNATNDSLL